MARGRPAPKSVRALSSRDAGEVRRGYLELRAQMAAKTSEERFAALASLIKRAARWQNARSLRTLRAIPHAAPLRSERVRLTLRASARDREFLQCVREADNARDAGEWDIGALLYGQAARFYPYHYGYLVQRSHCFKEMLRFTEAEIGYRDALALGAPCKDVWEHLGFVAVSSGFRGTPYPSNICEALTQEPFDELTTLHERLATSREAAHLIVLFYGPSARYSFPLLDHLRAAPLISELVSELIRLPAFLRANSQLVNSMIGDSLGND